MLSSLQRILSREKRSSSPSSLAPSSPVGIASNSIGSVADVNMEQLDDAHPHRIFVGRMMQPPRKRWGDDDENKGERERWGNEER